MHCYVHSHNRYAPLSVITRPSEQLNRTLVMSVHRCFLIQSGLLVAHHQLLSTLCVWLLGLTTCVDLCVFLRLQIMIWNLDCPEPVIKNPVRTISHHPDVVLSMSFNTDGSLLATTCKDRKVRLMESRSGTLLRVLLCARVHFFYLPFFCNGGKTASIWI